jgi:hypothetical protein
MCSECQDGCGGHMSSECYDSEHSDGEFGICDCDGQCGDLLNGYYAGDRVQRCIRSECSICPAGAGLQRDAVAGYGCATTEGEWVGDTNGLPEPPTISASARRSARRTGGRGIRTLAETLQTIGGAEMKRTGQANARISSTSTKDHTERDVARAIRKTLTTVCAPAWEMIAALAMRVSGSTIASGKKQRHAVAATSPRSRMAPMREDITIRRASILATTLVRHRRRSAGAGSGRCALRRWIGVTAPIRPWTRVGRSLSAQLAHQFRAEI